MTMETVTTSAGPMAMLICHLPLREAHTQPNGDPAKDVLAALDQAVLDYFEAPGRHPELRRRCEPVSVTTTGPAPLRSRAGFLYRRFVEALGFYEDRLHVPAPHLRWQPMGMWGPDGAAEALLCCLGPHLHAMAHMVTLNLAHWTLTRWDLDLGTGLAIKTTGAVTWDGPVVLP